MSDREELSNCEHFTVDGVRLYSLRQVNDLPTPTKEGIYRHLLPTTLLETYGIDPDSLCDAHGNQLVTFTCPEGSRRVEVDVRPEIGFPDPLLYLELADTPLNQIEVTLFMVNDPASERFETESRHAITCLTEKWKRPPWAVKAMLEHLAGELEYR